MIWVLAFGAGFGHLDSNLVIRLEIGSDCNVSFQKELRRKENIADIKETRLKKNEN